MGDVSSRTPTSTCSGAVKAACPSRGCSGWGRWFSNRREPDRQRLRTGLLPSTEFPLFSYNNGVVMTSCRELDNSRSALSAASAFAIATAGANEGAPSKDKYRRMSLASAGAWGRLWGQQWPPRPRELSPFACAQLAAPGPWLVPTLLAPGSEGPGSAHLAPPPGRLGPSKADARGNPPPHPHGTGPVAEVERGREIRASGSPGRGGCVPCIH